MNVVLGDDERRIVLKQTIRVDKRHNQALLHNQEGKQMATMRAMKSETTSKAINRTQTPFMYEH